MPAQRFTIALIASALLSLTAGMATAQYLPPAPKAPGGKKIVTAGAVVKGVDGRGKVVYTDHPVDGVKEVKTLSGKTFKDVPDAAGPAAAAASSADSIVDWAQKTQAQMDEHRKQVQDINDKVAKQNCANAKESLATLGMGGRVVRLSPAGTPDVLSAEQIEESRSKANDVIAKNCK